MITNSRLSELVLSEDPTLALLAGEILRHRKDLLAVRRRCAELAGAISPEAGAAVREYAQSCEFINALGEPPQGPGDLPSSET